jgi:hypothetical protein
MLGLVEEKPDGFAITKLGRQGLDEFILGATRELMCEPRWLTILVGPQMLRFSLEFELTEAQATRLIALGLYLLHLFGPL